MRYEVTVKLLSHCVTVFWANKRGVLHDGVFPFFFPLSRLAPPPPTKTFEGISG